MTLLSKSYYGIALTLEGTPRLTYFTVWSWGVFMTSCQLSVNTQQPYTTHPPTYSAVSRVALSVFQSLSHVQLFVTPWIPARQASLSYTISKSLLKLMFTELLMPSKHLILCSPLLLLPSIFHSIRVFYKEMAFSIE